jgi:hypothetical protein
MFALFAACQALWQGLASLFDDLFEGLKTIVFPLSAFTLRLLGKDIMSLVNY